LPAAWNSVEQDLAGAPGDADHPAMGVYRVSRGEENQPGVRSQSWWQALGQTTAGHGPGHDEDAIARIPHMIFGDPER
jgi:hypothetical protein